MPKKPTSLVVNSPYEEPTQHWSYNRERRTFSLLEGRRPAGYLIASQGSQAFDDPGVFIEIPLVNQIRPRVKEWREAGYPGATSITRRLLEHWTEREDADDQRLFFCQLEAAETLIYLIEAPDADKVGLDIPSDGGPFQRWCAKMATGSGKTIVMAMVVAWHILNKVAYPRDTRFAKNALVIAPGLTVKSRLAVLEPSHPDNYYKAFDIVPSSLLDKLRQGKSCYPQLARTQLGDRRESCTKSAASISEETKSDEAYVREVLGEMARARNLLVVNDEAHHAWRVPFGSKVQGVSKDEIEEATKWVGGLDRIHKARRILSCYDFSATPFVPSGKKSAEETLFDWIVSDFGLNDAIESGLVKTPRVVVRDDAVPDARTYKSRLYHIYNDSEVKGDLSRKAKPEEPLPDLVTNGYHLLGYDWWETAKAWEEKGIEARPVMITVANRTETAARVKYAFDRNRMHIGALSDSERILHIDSKVLSEAEATETSPTFTEVDNGDDGAAPVRTKKEQAEWLRQQVDTVGQIGKPGGPIQNVISVGMLSEGWDAKTVTHIMGLRAFTSQLLCEQVVGRGLRRTSYEVNQETGLFEPEYVNIFGVPFTFLPHESQEGVIPPPPKPKTAIEPVADKAAFEIRWPNVVRIDHVYRPRLSLDWDAVALLELNASQTARLADLAPMVEGKPDISQIDQIDLEELGRTYRMQRIAFEVARDVYDQMQTDWKGGREYLLAQLVLLVDQFVRSDKIYITPPLFEQEPLRRRLTIMLNMTKVVQHIWEAIRFDNTEALTLVFDRDRPIRSTGDMAIWYTGKPCEYTSRSHINCCVYDSAWEASEAFALDHSPHVAAWAKNDHLDFKVQYIYNGVVKKYLPDFLIRFKSGNHLIWRRRAKIASRIVPNAVSLANG